MTNAREIHLKERPEGLPTRTNFALVEQRLNSLVDGQILIRNLWISVDPYMRGRMIDRESYMPPFQLNQALDGAAVGVVEESRSPDFKPGDLVSNFSGWRDHAVVEADSVFRIDDDEIPPQAYLGTLGIPGLTAYTGLTRIAQLKKGSTVFISAASGAVGTVATQIALLKGCRVIGSVGSDEKAAWLKEIGANEVINYKTTEDLTQALATAAPDGIDVYFDNVGGDHLEAALAVANSSAQFVLCGMIAQYNATSLPPGPRNIYLAVEKNLKLQGFIIGNHFDLMPEFVKEMSAWIKDGKVTWRESIVEGLENAPDAFIGLFKGENFGKMLVKLDS